MESNDKLTRLTEGAGPANPFRKSLTPSRPEEGELDVMTSFHDIEAPAGGLPGPMMDGPPYTVKDGSYKLATRLLSKHFHAVKLSAHAHDRMEERTPFHRSYVNQLQLAADMLPLNGEAYHLPLRAKDGTVAGYAQFKRVPNRNKPVLATVLAPHMTPGGENIESMLKHGSAPNTNDAAYEAGQFDTDHIDPRPPESSAWNRKAQHGFAPEDGAYALRKAFDGVDTKPLYEVIEDGIAPAETAELW